MKRKDRLNLIIIITSLISFMVVVLSDVTDYKYNYLWILPLIYTIVFILLIMPTLNTGKFKVVTYSFTTLSWIRLVLIPFMNGITGTYENDFIVNISESSVNMGLFLISWEIIITSLILFLIVKSKVSKEYKGNLYLKGNKSIYGMFIFLAIVLYVFIGRNLNIINFLIISLESQDRIGDLTNTSHILIRQIIKVALLFSFVWITSVYSGKYSKNKKKMYVLIPVIVGLFNIAIIVGERRLEQIYTSFVVLFILSRSFKEHRKKIVLSVISMASFVLIFMSIYKHFAAFIYGSYSDALLSSGLNLSSITKTLQSYFFGIDNTSVAIEFSKSTNLSFTNYLYDHLRSVFGISFLLKDQMTMTIEHFNTFIYGFEKSSGHLLSGVNYGYIYFGWFLSPIVVVINIVIALFIENLFNKTTSIELKYIYGYMLVRFATNIFVNTPPLISLSTIMFFTAGFVYIFSKFINSPTQTMSLSSEKLLIKINK